VHLVVEVQHGAVEDMGLLESLQSKPPTRTDPGDHHGRRTLAAGSNNDQG
jgi:hypothetical protein